MPVKRAKLRTAAKLVDQALELTDLVGEPAIGVHLHRSLETIELALESLGEVGHELNDEDRDASFLEYALTVRDSLEEFTDASLRQGTLTLEQLFDVDYRPIPGTFPERYETGLSEWAATNWRPMFDRATAKSLDIYSFVASDMNGFLPTHITARSQPPSGRIDWDIARCRHGRISYDARVQRYKTSDLDHILTIHRMDGFDGDVIVCRLLFVPLFFADRRWGDLEMAYSLA